MVNAGTAPRHTQVEALSLEGGDDGCDGDLEPWEWKWLGRILVMRLPGGYVVYIGPHWYCSLVMLAFILGIGTVHTSSELSSGDARLILGGVGVTTLTTFAFLRCALSNPGILRPPHIGNLPGAPPSLDVDADSLGSTLLTSDNATPLRFGSHRNDRHCAVCNVTRPQKCTHCQFCAVCIEGFDHHCPWMGKCIGRANVCAFYNFLVVSFGSLGYIFLITMLQAPSDVGIWIAT